MENDNDDDFFYKTYETLAKNKENRKEFLANAKKNLSAEDYANVRNSAEFLGALAEFFHPELKENKNPN